MPADPETDDACYRRILFSSTPQDALCAWQPEYLLGSWSFLPAVSASDAEAKAREEMKAEIRKRIEKEQYEASEFKNLSYRTFDLKYNNKAWRLVQIPAYFVISSYRGGFYFEAVNGATGKSSAIFRYLPSGLLYLLCWWRLALRCWAWQLTGMM